MSDLMADSYFGVESCPNCDHSLELHDATNGGCQVGWTYDADGVANSQGCICNLAVVFTSEGDG